MGYNSGITTMGGRAGGGGGRGMGGGRSFESITAKYQKDMADLQAQRKEAMKTYNRIKKELGGGGGPISVGFHAQNVMNKMGMKSPSQITEAMNALTQKYHSDTFSL